MRTWGLVVALGVSLLGVRHADAVKIVIPLPIDVDVPPNPAFVVLTRWTSHLDPTDLSGNRHFTFSVTRIDDYWSRVTVDARPGDVFMDHLFEGHAHYRVLARPTRVHRDVVDASLYLSGSDRYWDVHSVGDDHRVWTRIDWAYDPADIDRGLYGSVYEESQDHALWRAEDFAERVFLRVMNYRIDGTTEASRFWLERRGDEVEIHDGEGVAGDASTTRPPGCRVDEPRPVPVDPTFHVNVDELPRFHAVTMDGRELTTRLAASESYDWTLSVTAPEGTAFTVQRLPVVPGCTRTRFLYATRDRSRDEPPRVSGSRFGGRMHVDVDEPDTWATFDVVNHGEPATEELVGWFAENLYVTTSYYTPDRALVTITPVWGEARGASWTGWVFRTDDHGTVTDVFEPSPANPVSVTSPERVTAMAQAVSRGHGRPFRPVLVIVLFLGLVAIRPRIVARWSP